MTPSISWGSIYHSVEERARVVCMCVKDVQLHVKSESEIKET